MLRDEGHRAAETFLAENAGDLGKTLYARPRPFLESRSMSEKWDSSASLSALGLLIWLAYRGWSVLLLAPAAALVAAAAAQASRCWPTGPRLSWVAAAQFLAQFFPLFLLGALFGKLMEDSGSVEVIAGFMTEKLGNERAMLAVVLAGAIVTYGGVSLFVALFIIAPMAEAPIQSG